MKPKLVQKIFSLLIIAALLFGWLPLTSTPALAAPSTYYTTADNENNAGTGTPDNDMDNYLCSGEPSLPVEFNINVPTLPDPGEQVTLAIYAFDVDEEAGEIDYVYFNDPGQASAIGTMSGTNNTWSMSIFDVTGLVVAGNNRVDITVATGWCINVDWGQLLVDGGDQVAGAITDLGATGGDWNDVQVSVDVEAYAAGDFALDLNLINSSGENKDIVQDTFNMPAPGSITRNHSMSTETEPAEGEQFTIQAIIYDPATGYIHNVEETTWVYGDTSIPWLDETPINGTVAPGTCDTITVTFDSTGLPDGTYLGDLIINSNDPVLPSITVPVTLNVIADYDVNVSVSMSYIQNHNVLTYTVKVKNTGPDTAVGVLFTDTVPVEMEQLQWTCSGAGGATCSIPAGTDNPIEQSLDLPADGEVTIVIVGVLDNYLMRVVNTAWITLPPGYNDANPNDNSVSLSNGYRILCPLIYKNADLTPLP